MRLWDAEIPSSEETKYRTIEQRREVEDLVSVLYPDDSKESGRILRLKQEYFLYQLVSKVLFVTLRSTINQ